MRTTGAVDLRTLVLPRDEIHCTLLDHTEVNVTVTTVEPDAIIAGPRRISRDDITQLQVTRFDKKKTTTAAVGAAFGLAVGAAVAASGLSHIKVPAMGH